MVFAPPPYIYVIAVSLLASLTVFYRLKPSDAYLKWFPPFLLVTLAAESAGLYLTYLRLKAPDLEQYMLYSTINTLLYNLFSTLEFCFYFWIISLVISNMRVKRTVRITNIVYAVIALINIFFFQGAKTKTSYASFHTITYSVGCLLIVAFCIYYFLELFRLPKSIQLKNNPAFWICSGLLFFYCCGFPLLGLTNVLQDISPMLVKRLVEILNILNIFLYSLFTIAFLCRSGKYTSSPL